MSKIKVVTSVLWRNRDAKNKVKELPNGIFEIANADFVFRPIACEYDTSAPLDNSPAKMRDCLGYGDLPIDVLRGYFRFVDHGGSFSDVTRGIFLDYVQKRYSLLLKLPCEANYEISCGVCPMMYFEENWSASKRKAKKDFAAGLNAFYEYVAVIAAATEKLCPDSRVYLEKVEIPVDDDYIDYSHSTIIVSLPLSCKASVVDSVVALLDAMAQDSGHTVDELLQLVADEAKDRHKDEFFSPSLEENEEGIPMDEGEDWLTPQVAHVVFKNGEETVAASFLHYNGEDNTADPREWIPREISETFPAMRRFDRARPKDTKDAAWLILMCDCCWGWKFEDESEIPPGAEMLTFDISSLF